MSAKVVNYFLSGIENDIKEAEESEFGRLKEFFIDSFLHSWSDEDDIDGYNIIFSREKPKKDNVISNDVEINRAEIYLNNIVGEEIVGPLLEELKNALPRHCKYLWSDKKQVAFQTSKFKHVKPYLVPKPGYKGPVDVEPEHEEASLSNGYRVMKLKTTDEIKTEGRKLTHCVHRKDMGYISKALQGEITLLSLRGPDGGALLTIEVDSNGGIRQIKGKKNRLPGFGYGSDSNKFCKRDEVEAVIEWLKMKNISPHLVSDLGPALKNM